MTPLDDVRSLYIHIPFCERKCEYCDFTSVAGVTGQHGYAAALASELRMLGALLPAVELDTIFVGGGTPSLIEPALLAGVMDAVRDAFRVAPGAEVTLEANPSSTSVERAARWRAAGFNRVSIGVQSLEPDILRFLGRVHDAARAVHAVAEVREAGFDNVSCDLIYAVPGLDDGRWWSTVGRVAALQIDHVSCYELTVEPGTPLHTMVRRGAVIPTGGDAALRQHRLAQDLLHAAGFEQYEVSNFARGGSQCRHNLGYWRNRYYVAAGVGAHGHLPASAAPALGLTPDAGAVAVRFWHGRGIRAYCAAVRDGMLPIRDFESVTRVAREEERVMLGLRTREGVALTHREMWPDARALRDAGLITLDDDVVRTTRAGETVLNAVTLRLTNSLHAHAMAGAV